MMTMTAQIIYMCQHVEMIDVADINEAMALWEKSNHRMCAHCEKEMDEAPGAFLEECHGE